MIVLYKPYFYLLNPYIWLLCDQVYSVNVEIQDSKFYEFCKSKLRHKVKIINITD